MKYGRWLLLGSLAFLYFNLFAPPFTPLCLGEDEGIWLMDALRMLGGQVMYRDFFQFTAPGTQWTYFVLFVLFGPRNWIPNVLLLLLGLTLVWLTIVISRRVMNEGGALLTGLLFLTLAFRRAFAVTHLWWNILAVMGSVVLIIEKRTPARVAAAGALTGLSLWFNQTQGLMALLGLATFLAWEHTQLRLKWQKLLKQEARLLSGCVVASVVLYADWAWKAGLKQLFYCTVTFLQYYPSFSAASTWQYYAIDMPHPSNWHAWPRLGAYLFIRGLLPLVYLIFFIYYRRRRSTQPADAWNRLVLLAIVGSFLFIGSVPTATWFRFCTVSIPGLVLFVWLVSKWHRFGPLFTKVLWAIALLLAAGEAVAWQVHWRADLLPPGGRTAVVMPVLYDRYRWVLSHTQPHELFFEAVDADMYFTLGLRNPTRVPLVAPTNLTRPEQVRCVVTDLERQRVRFVFWSPSLDAGNDYKPAQDHLEPLREYLRGSYHVVKEFAGGDQVWERDK